MAKLRMTNRKRQGFIGIGFVSIWIVGYLLFTLYPMMHALYLSFHSVKITPVGIRTEYVGLEYYKYAFSDTSFIEARLLTYLKSMVLNVPITVVFALIIAMLINQKIIFKGAFRTIFFLPVIITSGPVFSELMSQGATRVANIESMGVFDMINNSMSPVLASPITYLFTQIITVLWFSGVQILIFLAGLQKVDNDMYEAARIDGASSWEIFWKITLPVLRPLVLVNMIYTIVNMSTFADNEIITFIRMSMFSTITGYGYAAALSWIYFVLISLILIIWTGLLNLRKE